MAANWNLNFSQLTALLHDAQHSATYTHDQAWAALKAASFALETKIKQDMPVDTGRARASWGHWTGADIKKPIKDGGGGAVYDEDEGALNILQGSNVEYIGMLNAGHSRQAPAGFIDKDTLKAQVELEKALGLIDPLSPGGQQLQYMVQFM